MLQSPASLHGRQLGGQGGSLRPCLYGKHRAPLRLVAGLCRKPCNSRPSGRKARQPAVTCSASCCDPAASVSTSQRQRWPAQDAMRSAVAVAVQLWLGLRQSVAAAVRHAKEHFREQDTAEINSHIRASKRHLKTLSAVAPFAASTTTSNTFLLLTKAVANFIKMYLLLLFLRVLLSWFPAFNWERQPWLALRQMTDPYLNIFRGLVPPLLGTIDFTPLLGFFILQSVGGFLETIEAEDELEEMW